MLRQGCLPEIEWIYFPYWTFARIRAEIKLFKAQLTNEATGQPGGLLIERGRFLLPYGAYGQRSNPRSSRRYEQSITYGALRYKASTGLGSMIDHQNCSSA